MLEMTRCFLIDSILTKMMRRSAILHATRFRNLVVRREEKCPGDLNWGIKPKLSITSFFLFLFEQSLWGRETETTAKLNSSHWTECLSDILKMTTNTSCANTTHVWCWRFQKWSSTCSKSATSLITQTPNLQDERSQQQGIWQPDDEYQDHKSIYCQKEEWQDAERVNAQETTLRLDASYDEEAARDEKSTATNGSLRDSDSTEVSETEDFSHSETVGFTEEALEPEDRAESRRRTRTANVPQFSGKVSTHLGAPESEYVKKTKQSTKQSKMTIGTSGTWQWRTRLRLFKTRRLGL